MTDSVLVDKEPVVLEPAEHELPELVIEPPKGWISIDWKEVWRYRELLYYLTLRDVQVRYKQTALGCIWVLLQPLVNTLVFSLFFGRMAGLDKHTGGVPYPVYVLTGQLLWTLFANSITSSGNSLVSNANLISKVYFPRLIIPLSAVGVGLVDFAVSGVLLAVMMAVFRVQPTWEIVFVPAFILGTVITATGVGTLLSALTVSYRDFRYVVNFLVQLWFFISPVVYPQTIVPDSWRWILALNPMTGLINSFRAAFLGQPVIWPEVAISMTVGVVIFFVGTAYFRSVERRFADII
jgi:lipopolysaccharide transport system permease protein